VDKDWIAGTAKEAKGSVNEAAGRWLAMPSYSLTARRSAPLQDLECHRQHEGDRAGDRQGLS